MKKLLSSVLIVITLLAIVSFCTACYSPQSGGLLFTEVEGGYQVTGVSHWNRFYKNFTVDIPSHYNGKPVVAISANAFFGYTSLISVNIPDTVKTIGDGAFGGCALLTEVNLPDSVTYIGDGAFSLCPLLMNISIPDSITFIGRGAFAQSDGLRYSVYDNCKYLGNGNNPYVLLVESASDITSCNIHKNAKMIYQEAFSDRNNLESVIIPDGVTTIAWRAFFSCDSLKSITIPDSVTGIDSEAFSYCESLTSVTIGDGVSCIRNCTFNECRSLIDLTIGNGVTCVEWCAFDFYENLNYNIYKSGKYIGNSDNPYMILMHVENFPDPDFEDDFDFHPDTKVIYNHALASYYADGNIIIPDGVTCIGGYAFHGCNFESIVIPNSVKCINPLAFEGCDNLKFIYYEGSQTDWNNIEGAVVTGATIIYDSPYDYESQMFTSGICGDNLTWVLDSQGTLTISGTGPMYNYSYDSPWHMSTAVKNVIIQDGVTTIGDCAFTQCESLTSVTIPDSVTTIGNWAFEYCNSLTSITIPNSVTTIGNYVFYFCKSLSVVTIGDGVSSIDNAAFFGCDSLTKFKVGAENTYYSTDNNGILYNKDKTTLIRAPGGITGSVTIPDSVTSIGDFAFSYCESMTKVTIPDSVTTIGYSAFEGCSSLTSVIIPDSVTTIDSGVFQSCESLTSVTISNSVTTIPGYAFCFCESLTNVTIPNGVRTIGDYAFQTCKSLTSVTIPGSVTYIGFHAFSSCDNLQNVYYYGSREQWKKISINTNTTSNSSLTSASITFIPN